MKKIILSAFTIFLLTACANPSVENSIVSNIINNESNQKNLCEIITIAEISSITGIPIDKSTNTAGLINGCLYESSKELSNISIIVHEYPTNEIAMNEFLAIDTTLEGTSPIFNDLGEKAALLNDMDLITTVAAVNKNKYIAISSYGGDKETRFDWIRKAGKLTLEKY